MDKLFVRWLCRVMCPGTAFCFFVLLLAACKPQPAYRAVPPDVVLRNGDLAFRLGNSVESRAVVTADRDASFSHVGILIFADNAWQVVHAVPGEAEKGCPERVKMDTLPLFFRSDRARRGAVLRLDVPDSVASQAAERAVEFLKRRVLFDSAFQLDDTTRMYCTELVYHAYLPAGVDVSGGLRHSVPGFPYPMVWPSDLLKSNRLETIWQFE